jgi:hypothetical protein
MLPRVPGAVLAPLRGASVSRLGGLALVVLVVATVAWRVVPAFDAVNEDLDATRGLTRLQRELAPARSVDIDPRPIEAAAARIPEDATFAILVGAGYEFTHEISRRTLPAWAAYRLLPRRRVADAASAEWVITYGEPLAPHSVFPARTVDLGLGVTLARVR